MMERSEGGSLSLNRRTAADGAPLTILIVEDSATQALQLRKILERQGYEVSAATDGIAALSLLEDHIPTLIISDIMMPGMDGYTLCQRIKENSRFNDVPVLLLTSLSDLKDVLKGLESGADSFVVKPYDAAFLLYRIESILTNRKLRDKRGGAAGADERIEVFYGGRTHTLAKLPDAQNTLDLLLGAYETVIQSNLDLTAAKVEADRANRAKSDFLSSMSHELRTPLNAILGFAQLLELDKLEVEQHESVQQILRGGHHLLDLITQVLDVAKIESGRVELSIEPVDFGELLRDTVSLIHPVAAQRQISIAAPGDSECSVKVMADQQRLKQVLLNLLSNAIKYNRERGSVTISCGQIEDRLRIGITDTGTGLTPEDIGRLFTPFERLGAEKRAIEGTGLGLSLCKRLIESMQGKIEVESVPGAGSTFSFELPLAESASAPIEDDQTPAPEDRKTILYIEDNLCYAELISETLKRRPGVKLLAATHGALGIDLARVHQPDLILLDLQLPDINGEEVLHELRGDARTSTVPVVVISGEASAGDVNRLLSAGACDYLDKPLDLPKFFATLDRVLELSPAA